MIYFFVFHLSLLNQLVGIESENNRRLTQLTSNTSTK